MPQRNFERILAAKGDLNNLWEGGETVPLDMLDRLVLDPGTRTIGELMQEREWAVWEIRRLRRDVDRLSQKKEALRIEGEQDHAVDPELNAQRLLRLSEVYDDGRSGAHLDL
jgi:hypothetical protein